MRLEQSKFLGTTTELFESEYSVVSLVSYHNPVSEDWHFHENIHLSMILKGGNKESRKSGDFQATSGKIFYYNEGEPHFNRHTAFPSKNLNIELKRDFFRREGFCGSCFSEPIIQNVDATISLMNIYHEFHFRDLYSGETINFSLNQLVDPHDVSTFIPPWIKQLREILEDRWDEFISLNELANIFNVHPVTISKYFRKYFNCTLGDFMRKIKIEKAIFLLINTNLSITEISDRCGFTDSSHMVRTFKAYIGFLPNQLRTLL